MEIIIKNPEPDWYNDAKFERKPHGTYISDGVEVGFSMQCPHCNCHFLSIRNSGHRRTFCMRCNAITCGNVACDPCRPFEEQLDAYEKACARRAWS